MESNDAGTMAGLKYLMAVCRVQVAANSGDPSAFLNQVVAANFTPTVTSQDDNVTPELAQQQAKAVAQSAKACIQETASLAHYLAGTAQAPAEFGLNVVATEPVPPA